MLFVTETHLGIIGWRKRSNVGAIRLPDDDPVEDPDAESGKLMADHVPARLSFRGISYMVPGTRPVLNQVDGIARPGELTAIMGASGAGKTSLLDILAGRSKKGIVKGDVRVNGTLVSPSVYKRIVGFVLLSQFVCIILS